jgi:hypothetical protein
MTVVAVASHRFDYSDGPIVVFQPLPPLGVPTLSFAAGSVDYFDQQNAFSADCLPNAQLACRPFRVQKQRFLRG